MINYLIVHVVDWQGSYSEIDPASGLAVEACVMMSFTIWIFSTMDLLLVKEAEIRSHDFRITLYVQR